MAQEGAAIWIDMSRKERNEWVDVSIKDFEQRVVAWKEKEVIEGRYLSPGHDLNSRDCISPSSFLLVCL